MTNMLAIIEVPDVLTAEQVTTLRTEAEGRLGADFKVLVLAGGATCKVVPILSAGKSASEAD